MLEQGLPPELEEELQSCLKRIFSKALRAQDTESSEATAASRQASRAKLCDSFQNLVSGLGSAFNAAIAPSEQLPDELLCLVWSFLPMTGVFSVAQVCRRWRAVALRFPRLWCNVEYTSDVHHEECACQVELAFGYGGSSSCPDGPGSDNIEMVQACLSRSGETLPIALRVDIMTHDVNDRSIDRLRYAMSRYCNRIDNLFFFSDDPLAFSYFLEWYMCLPSLRTLWIHFDSERPAPQRSNRFTHTPLSLPELRELQIVGPCDVGGKLPQELPALTFLWLEFVNTQEIVDYLAVTPALRDLRLVLPSGHAAFEEESPEAYRRVGELSARVNVEITNVSSLRSERIVLAMFGASTSAELYIEYATLHRLEAPSAGLRTLLHVNPVERVSLLLNKTARHESDSLAFSVRSPTGTLREVNVPGKGQEGNALIASQFWSHLTQPPRALVVDARLWPALKFRPAHLDAMKELTLVVPRSFNFNEILHGHSPIAESFTALEEFRLDGRDLDVCFRIPSQGLVRFLNSLRLSILPRFVFRKVTLDGDAEAIAKLVHVA
ncbi:hypothetical protein AURDEDRAFT_162279 [Auricularia subglabra TFB-10046 SS5]|nr:hypothetical protein AURDEDRAFT_162279 [Auricularia subglabra TFB-10046 SS5]